MIQEHDNSAAPNGHAAETDDETQPASIIALRILEALAATSSDLGVTTIANKLGIAKPRVYRHLSALRDYGYVTQNPATSLYSISWRFYLLGQQISRKFSLTSLARPVMQHLSDSIGYTVVVSTFNEREVVILDYIRGGISGLEIGLSPGAHFPLSMAAQGKVVLAFGPESLSQVFFDKLALDAAAIVRLKADVEATRKRGWADAPQELFSGINAIAAPVFSADNNLMGCLAIIGSIDHMPHPPSKELLTALLNATDQISNMLGASSAQ